MTNKKDHTEKNSKKVSRRDLVKIGAATGIGLTLNPTRSMAFFHKTPRKLPTEERQLVIIGSGFGGAISAQRLTQAGVEVTLLEKGARWDFETDKQRFSSNLYPDGRSTWLNRTTVIPVGPALPIRRNTGVLEGRDMAGFRILSGAAYGGGSIVYGGVLKKPEKHLFEKVFPAEVSFDSLQPHYDEVGRRLQRSTLPQDLAGEDFYQHVRVMKKHCEKSGIETEDMHTATDWDIVRDEAAGRIPPSIIHGEAVYGVNSGAKATLDNTYLKEAEESGLLEVKALHQVSDLRQLADGRYSISFEQLDDRGNVIAEGEIITAKLILSAGSMGTSSLLVRAKAKGMLPRLNDEVGRGWGNNGNAYALRLGLEATGRWHGGPPAVGIKDYDNPMGPLFIEHPQLPIGIEFFGLLYFAIGITPTRGHFYYDQQQDEVKLSWPKSDPGQAKVNQAFLNTMEQLNRDNGGFVSAVIDNFRDSIKDDAVYHPLGGCVMGKACDFYGRVKNYPGLYVNDGSLMPGSSACTNPAFTISALAVRNIEHVIANDF
ncbi:MAG: GMC oxidoreductase [Oligoflexus sp.]